MNNSIEDQSTPNLPLISIVTPSFNQAQFLDETIRSILNQDYPNIEFVIIDGGSSDYSQDIIRKYESDISYWVSEPDKGQSHAINKGFDHCTGDLITFQNSDDIYLPNAFSYAAEQWKRHPDCGAIVGGFKYVNEKSELSLTTIPPYLPYQTPLDLSIIPPEKWRLHQVATLYSKKALNRVGRFVREDYNYVMDRELLFRVIKEFQIVLDDRPYAAFRRHSESKTMSHSISFGEEFARLYLESPSYNKQDQNFKERIARFYRGKGYIHYAKYNPDLVKSNHAFLKALQIYPKFAFTKNFWTAFTRRNFQVLHKKF